MSTNDESYLFFGFGQQYIEDSIDCIETLRHFKDKRKISIVVNPEDENFTKNKRIFDHVISYDIYSDDLFTLCQTNFEKFCLLPRLRLPNFLVSKYTIVLDTDILCSYYTDKLWSYFINKNQSLIMLGSKDNKIWHWGRWGQICDYLGTSPYETHGGLFFIDSSNKNSLQNIWNSAIYAFKNYSDLGMLKLYQNGRVDEPCFSYSFSKNNLVPVEFSEFPAMTFNLEAIRENIPTKNMTEQNQKQIMNDYITFIHMFEKNYTSNFQLLKKKILQYEG
jgi:hypothetical protein